jgi:uncharacterized membrane protein
MRATERLWRTAHLLAMVTVTLVFFAAALVGHGGYLELEVTTSALVLTLVGFAIVTFGGWLGGTVVYVHGMRVLTSSTPADRAVTQLATSEKRAAAGGDEGEERGGLTRY